MVRVFNNKRLERIMKRVAKWARFAFVFQPKAEEEIAKVREYLIELNSYTRAEQSHAPTIWKQMVRAARGLSYMEEVNPKHYQHLDNCGANLTMGCPCTCGYDKVVGKSVREKNREKKENRIFPIEIPNKVNEAYRVYFESGQSVDVWATSPADVRKQLKTVWLVSTIHFIHKSDKRLK